MAEEKRLGSGVENWSIKYYKGLGTSTTEEAKEYDPLDVAGRRIRYHDFVKEMILSSISDNQRAIPSAVDGFRAGQRKIIFSAFKRNFVEEATVAAFCGYVRDYAAYDHEEEKLAGTVIGMAQDFVGSNNINLLLPNGQFGTRYQGGEDHAAPRYIYTQLSPVTRLLFPEADDILLNYLEKDGKSIEPTWYMPIIPMVLVNGCEGIGTDWSTYVPSYNPFDIIRNIRHLLNDEPLEAMHPWYKGFIGSIERNVKDPRLYVVRGSIMELGENTVRISELPIRKWSQDYKEFLESVTARNDKSTDPFIEEYYDNSAGDIVDFSICMSEGRLPALKKEGLLKKLKLSTSISTKNMRLVDSRGVMKKYDTPEQILEEFFYLRLEFYENRKKTLLPILEKEMLKCISKYRFIEGVIDGSIIVINRKRADLFLELKAKDFTPFPNKEKASKVSEDISDYDYLHSMPVGTLTLEKMQELLVERHKLVEKIDDLQQTSAECLWTRDLNALQAKLDEELKKYEKKLETERKSIQGSAYVKGRVKKGKAGAVEDSMEVSENTMPETAQVKKMRRKGKATS